MARDFDPKSYKCLEVIGEVGPIRVAIWQYKANAPKIKIQRFGKRRDGSEYAKDPGGLTAEEAQGLAPLLEEAVGALLDL